MERWFSLYIEMKRDETLALPSVICLVYVGNESSNIANDPTIIHCTSTRVLCMYVYKRTYDKI